MEVSPSILTCDFSNLKNDLEDIKNLVKYIHIDVMDGDFVPNLTFGPKFVKDFRGYCPQNIFDVHLMISNPLKYIKNFAEAGSDIITFHVESKSPVQETIKEIKSYGKLAGLSIKPKTEVSAIKDYLADLDLVLVMSVEPGFGGQKFMPNAVDKIKELYDLRKKNGYNYLIEVDGGVNDETVKLCKDAGIDIVVAGSYVMNAENRKERIDNLLK
ncbi:MAG: ribulose-phosphate 3-epimerase [Acholeplasmatales bacterium]|nr:ribulose-phosphate 3-epimerase [Acholeplasmatales bacterium]